MIRFLLLLALATPSLAATGDSASPTTLPSADWPRLSTQLGLTGVERGGVYTVTVPRADLGVATPGMGELPVAAGIETSIHFFMCPCGKLNVAGTFVVADYESDDVVDELRAARLHVVSIAPMFINEQPRVLAIRFQGEGVPDDLAAAFKAALERTGEARNPKIVLPR